MKHRPFALCLACIVAACLVPAGPRAESAPADRPVSLNDILAEEASREPRWTGLWRARLSYPQTVSAGIGVIRARLPKEWECVSTCQLQGWLVQLEPGIHGAQLAVGYGTLMAEKRRRDRFLTDVWVGYGVKGVVLRTWGDAGLTPPDQTLAGVEFTLSVTRINISLGSLRRISSHDGADWIISGGIGIGF